MTRTKALHCWSNCHTERERNIYRQLARKRRQPGKGSNLNVEEAFREGKTLTVRLCRTADCGVHS